MDRSTPHPAGPPPARVWFAGLRLEADGILLRGEMPLQLPPKELAVLRLLLARAGEVVTLAELKHAAWGDEDVSARTISTCIASLRARLQPADCVQSLYKRGYRICVTVEVEAQVLPAHAPRLAILPFSGGYGVPQHLSTALVEEVIPRLDRIQGATASVIPCQPVRELARRGLAGCEIGRALHADLVLAGCLYARPGYLRLRAEMIRSEDGAPLWVEDLLVTGGELALMASEFVKRLLPRL